MEDGLLLFLAKSQQQPQTGLNTFLNQRPSSTVPRPVVNSIVLQKFTCIDILYQLLKIVPRLVSLGSRGILMEMLLDEQDPERELPVMV